MLLDEIVEAVRHFGPAWFEYTDEQIEPDFFPSLTPGEIRGLLSLMRPLEPSRIDTVEKCLGVLRESGVLAMTEVPIGPQGRPERGGT